MIRLIHCLRNLFLAVWALIGSSVVLRRLPLPFWQGFGLCVCHILLICNLANENTSCQAGRCLVILQTTRSCTAHMCTGSPSHGGDPHGVSGLQYGQESSGAGFISTQCQHTWFTLAPSTLRLTVTGIDDVPSVSVQRAKIVNRVLHFLA